MKVAFRVDGNKKLGLGHVKRCIVLAKNLQKRNVSCFFIIQSKGIKEFLESKGFKVFIIQQKNELEQIKNILTKEKCTKLVIDSKRKSVEPLLRNLEKHIKIILIDNTNIVKQIYPQVKIIKHGNIINLIKSCEIFITIDISTTMLEAQIFEKPIISVIVKNYNFVNATILNSDSYIRTNLDNFENIFKQLLNSSDLKNRLIVAGNKYLSNYIHFQNSSSKEFTKMLDKI